MTSKVRVDMPLCSHETTIVAEAQPDGMVRLEIGSTCKSVREYAELLGPVGPDDYVNLQGSRIHQCAIDVGLTPTCLLPTAVYNVVWAEVGMISKRLALKEGGICIRFEE